MSLLPSRPIPRLCLARRSSAPQSPRVRVSIPLCDREVHPPQSPCQACLELVAPLILAVGLVLEGSTACALHPVSAQLMRYPLRRIEAGIEPAPMQNLYQNHGKRWTSLLAPAVVLGAACWRIRTHGVRRPCALSPPYHRHGRTIQGGASASATAASGRDPRALASPPAWAASRRALHSRRCAGPPGDRHRIPRSPRVSHRS